jgi:hypothetical protein
MKVISFLIATLLLAASSPSQASDTADLTVMLHEFLAGASQDEAAAHDRFWAEDLVYTSSAGTRFGKAEIMHGLSEPPDPAADEPATVYSAEDISIRQYGDTAIVAFRLLGVAQDDSAAVAQYFNTGTFLKRDGVWQVVAWQATRIPGPD